MREFDALCLFPVKTYQPQEIKKIRLRYRVSQAVFAAYLNVSKTSVASWESGGEGGPALRQPSCLTWWIGKAFKQLRDPQISTHVGICQLIAAPCPLSTALSLAFIMVN